MNGLSGWYDICTNFENPPIISHIALTISVSLFPPAIFGRACNMIWLTCIIVAEQERIGVEEYLVEEYFEEEYPVEEYLVEEYLMEEYLVVEYPVE